MPNVTGWNELMDGNITEASYSLYNTTWAGGFIMLVWVTLSAVLFMKTKNPLLCFFLGMVSFASLYKFLNPMSIGIMTVVLVFELAATLYSAFWS